MGPHLEYRCPRPRVIGGWTSFWEVVLMSHMLLGHLGCMRVNDWFGLCLPGSRPGSGQAVHMQGTEMNQKCFPLQGTVACWGRTGRDQCHLQGSGCGKRVVSPGSACLKAAGKELCCQPVCGHPAGFSLSTQQGSGKIRVRLCPISQRCATWASSLHLSEPPFILCSCSHLCG